MEAVETGVSKGSVGAASARLDEHRGCQLQRIRGTFEYLMWAGLDQLDQLNGS